MYGGWHFGKKKKPEHRAPLEVMVSVLMREPDSKLEMIKALPKSIRQHFPDPELAVLHEVVSRLEASSEATRAKIVRMYDAQVEDEEDDLWMLVLL